MDRRDMDIHGHPADVFSLLLAGKKLKNTTETDFTLCTRSEANG